MEPTMHVKTFSRGSVFFFFFCTHKSVGVCFPFLPTPLSDTLSSHPTGFFLFSTCWDVETGAERSGREEVMWLG